MSSGARRHNAAQPPFQNPSMIAALAAQEAQRPVQVIQQTTPFNDVQTVAFIAALGLENDPKVAVRHAQELLFDALATSEAFGQRVAEFRKKQQAEAEAAAARKEDPAKSPGGILVP